MLEAVHGGGESDPGVETDSVEPTSKPPRTGTDSDESATEAAEALPLDVTFEILKNRRRRLVLEYLRDTDESTTIGELAEHIAAIENDTTVQQLNAQQRKRVYIGLYQCHLPKMDDAGAVEFNQDRGRIKLGENVDPLYAYLDVVDEEDDDEEFKTAHAGGFIAFTSLFFAAQLSNAHAVASGIVVLFLLTVLAASYRANGS